ncbi:hypothetical protein V496_07743, partial [Pseudogymnoascus sp. VKM F-4515 (FW-2607)]
QPPQWLGAQGGQHEMSSSPAPHTVPAAGRFNGGPPHAIGGFTASPGPQHELSGGTPAPGPGAASAGFNSAAQSQAGSRTLGMAESRFTSEQYTSEAFVESVGGVLFRLSSRQVGVLHHLRRNEYILAKGRRNCGEAHQVTAVREVTEETGFPCHLLPLNMHTRAPPALETEQLGDQARLHSNICEPFTLQVRHLSESQIKLIWWFVVVVDEEIPKESLEKDSYAVELYSYTDVLDKLTFQMDREMVKKAIELVENTYTDNLIDSKFAI